MGLPTVVNNPKEALSAYMQPILETTCRCIMIHHDPQCVAVLICGAARTFCGQSLRRLPRALPPQAGAQHPEDPVSR